MKITIPLVGGSYAHDSLPFDAQTCVNLFPEGGGKNSKAAGILRRRPGLSLFATISGIGAIRGMYETSNNRLFAVRGSALVELSTAGVVTSRGTLSTTFGPVKMTDNGEDLGIADGTSVYKLTLATNTLATVSSPNCPSTTPSLDFVDGYIFGFNPSATISGYLGEFQHSDLYDLSTWDALNFYNAEGSPDALVALIANNREVWVFGSKSYEVWFSADATVAGTLWQRIPGAFRDIGCAATNSVAKIGGTIFWLGASAEGNAIVWMSSGYQAIQISNPPLETLISRFADLSDAIGFTYQYQGHQFYVLTFQTGDKTYQYDLATGEWSELAYRNILTGEQGRWRAICQAFFNGKNLVGDYANGNIYELSDSAYSDNSDPITWERTFPYFNDKRQIIFWESLEIGIETGVGLSSGSGSDPVVLLRWSDDGARTWSNWESKPIGAIGAYGTRVRWDRLGYSRGNGRVYQISGSDAVKIAIQDGATAEVSIGNS